MSPLSLPTSAPAVRPLQSPDADRWREFAATCPDATLFHRLEWKDIVENVFRHRTHYLLAERGAQVVGILPLAEVRSRLFGHALVSLPFAVYGGAATTDEVARQTLHGAAVELAGRCGVQHLELRNRVCHEPAWPRQQIYFTFRKSLHTDEDENFRRIPSKRRNMVRKAGKNGLRVQFDHSVDCFFRLYTDNVHRHGTPPLPKRYFAAVAHALGKDHEILTVVDSGGKPLAAAFLMYFRDEVTPYYVGDSPAARQAAANDFMYWQVIRRAVARGCRVFDWSRSKAGTGSYEFKRLWGFEPTPLHYEFRLFKRDSVPQNNPLNPKYRALIAIWQHLPRPLVNSIGPHIVRGLG